MGELRVKLADSQEEVQQFMKYVLRDLRAMEKMLNEDGWFEKEPIRIGAEQELCIVDQQAKANPISMEVLDKLEDSNIFTTEFAKFNLEINMTPLEFRGECLSQMEENLQQRVDRVREVAAEMDGEILMTGILPTIRKADVDLKNLTPLERYRALCQAVNKLRGESFELRIQGMDELLIKFDSPLLEAVNTGFQVHMQVTPEDFVQKYNYALALTGPVLACAVGSPIFLGKRLWSETRIALFQQSVDTRTAGDHIRDTSPRVTFGNEWVNDSILDIFREDTARYRVMLSSEQTEDVEQLMKEGTPPQMNALQVHNGTVYRWNRPCYGISNGQAHLRIENRVFPSGPTVTDEVANSAFWLGLMNKMDDYHEDIRDVMDFDDARMNFVAASKLGLDTSFRWVNNRRVNAVDLITEELIPIAREGLAKADVNQSDIDTYLEIIEERTKSGKTMSQWLLKNYASLMKENNSKEHSLAAITMSMIKYEKKGEPIHKWGDANIGDLDSWKPSTLLVEEFMTTDLFTVQKDDILQFVADLINWRRIRYVPVEDDRNRLVGLVTMRMLFREFNNHIHDDKELKQTVEDIMIKNPITIHPEASIMEAMDIMESEVIGCLPVVKNNRLVGIITETNYMVIAGRLIRILHGDSEEDE
ncbi:MAG: CBS domain-containing protein [Balneolaceae bacterium]|nr:CBS domain-containing protein [Balneolaceae bacterium]